MDKEIYENTQSGIAGEPVNPYPANVDNMASSYQC